MSYRIDYEALQRKQDPITVALFLSAAIAHPGFDRERTCRRCDMWDPKQGLDNYPFRPGAAEPHLSCNGCWLSLLDQVGPVKPRPHYRPLRQIKALFDIQFSAAGLRLGKEEARPTMATRPTCTNCGGEVRTEFYHDMTTGTPVRMAITRCVMERWRQHQHKHKPCPVLKQAAE